MSEQGKPTYEELEAWLRAARVSARYWEDEAKALRQALGNHPPPPLLAKRLHAALDNVIALFVQTPNIKYGEYTTLDEALDALAESARMLHLPLTVSIAQVIEARHGEIWAELEGGK